MVVDSDGDYTTPLVDDAECAYAYTENGITLCAIEKAWAEGETTFRKPISCHLYPIRLMRFSNGTIGLNYHRWSVCAAARACGAKKGIPVCWCCANRSSAASARSSTRRWTLLRSCSANPDEAVPKEPATQEGSRRTRA